MKLLLACLLVSSLAIASSASARTWYINAAGSGDAPTIQAGIDSASAGDTVWVSTGTYYEHDIQMKSGVFMRASSSNPENCVIDAQGQGRVMIFDGVDDTAKVQYMTFKGGHASGSGSDGCGGGVFLTNGSAPMIRLCNYIQNIADNLGGAICCEDSSAPEFQNGVVRENQAAAGGGGIAITSNAYPRVFRLLCTGNRTDGNGAAAHCSDNAEPEFHFCHFFNGIAAGNGGGLYCETGSTPSLFFCNLVFNFDGEGAYSDDDFSIPYIYCTDIFGNEGGDWVGRIADQDSTSGNFSLDPLFCDTTVVSANASMAVESCSPCLSGSHPYYNCGAQIGYVSSGCECGEATRPATWGTIKSLYR